MMRQLARIGTRWAVCCCRHANDFEGGCVQGVAGEAGAGAGRGGAGGGERVEEEESLANLRNSLI